MKALVVLIKWHPYINRWFCQIDMSKIRVDGSDTPRILIEDDRDIEILKKTVTRKMKPFEIEPSFVVIEKNEKSK